ncbi:hypothetical protein LTR95_014693 [Oleoguttula sp. CCFEE 5521]
MLLQAAHRHVSPMVDGDYKVHANYLDLPLEQIKAQFWKHDLVQVDYNFNFFVEERPPIRRLFSSHGYLTPDRTFVNAPLRQYFTEVEMRYRHRQDVQTQAYTRISPDVLMKMLVPAVLQFIRR